MYAYRTEVSVLPHVCLLLFVSAGAGKGTALHLFCPAPPAECVLCLYLHLWNTWSAALQAGLGTRNYSSLTSSRSGRWNHFSLEANPLDLASLNDMLPSDKTSFLSLSLQSWNFLKKPMFLKKLIKLQKFRASKLFRFWMLPMPYKEIRSLLNFQ